MKIGLLISILLFSTLANSESIQEYAQRRLKNGVWAGPTVTMGHLNVRADATRTEVELTAISGVELGQQHWPSESMGVHWAAEVGLPATIENVLDKEVGYARHMLNGGVYYRHFLDITPSSDALLIGSLFNVSSEQVQKQRPSVLLSRAIFTPELRVGYERTLFGSDAWWRSQFGLGYPFFVRESPTDSGRPDQMYAFQLETEVCILLTPRWGINARVRYWSQSFRHGGEATRAGGVKDVNVDDRYTSLLIAIRYSIAPE